MIPTQPYEQSEFHGGFTDDIYSDDPTLCAYNDNLLVDLNKKAFQRPGSDVYSYDHPQIPEGSRPLMRLFKFHDESWFIAQHSRELYYFTDQWKTFSGPTNNPAFAYSDETGYISPSEWQGHFFIADSQGGLPIKIYQDGSGDWQVRTAGLPDLAVNDNFVTVTATASLVALANNIRTVMLLHFSNSGYGGVLPHKTADTVAAAYVGAACTDLATCITLTGQLITAYESHYKDTLQGLTYHQKDHAQPIRTLLPIAEYSSTDMALLSTVAPTDIYECAARLNDLHDKYEAHEGHLPPHIYSSASVNLSVNPPTVARVENINRGPVANRNWQPLYDWSAQWIATYNLHLADGGSAGTAHSTAADTVTVLTPGAVTTIAGLRTNVFAARVRYFAHEYDAQQGGPSYHAATEASSHQLAVDLSTTLMGAGSFSPFDAQGDVSLRFGSIVSGISTLATRYNLHVQDLTAHFTTNPPYIINFGPGESFEESNYNYALHYFYSYQVGDVTYEDFGPVYTFAADSCLPAAQYPISVTGIPTLTNTSSTNYDTAKITIRIYRTENNGTIYFRVGEIANGTTSFSDNMSDEVLVGQERLYTTGGVVGNDTPPSAKCLHIVGGKGYYGNIIEDGIALPHRVSQSISGDIDACPGDFFDDLDDDVAGISSVATIPVVFCKRSIYRLEGEFDLLGRGAITHKAIQNPGSVGLVSENSLVQIDSGIMFAGTDGFYFTNAYTLIPLSIGWRSIYLDLVSTPEKAARIQGTYDSKNKRVLWSAQRNSEGSQNDCIFILDLNFPLEKPCWSTWSNGDHFAPTSILMFGGNLLRGDSRGYLFQHDDSLYTDPYINTNVTPIKWGTVQVKPDYITCAADFGTNSVRKWGTWARLELEDADLFLAGSTINDTGPEKSLAPIRRRKTLAWGDQTISWGEPTILWDFSGNTIRKRRMPSKSLRFTTKQMRYTSDLVLLKESGTIPGTATVDQTNLKVTLDNSTYTWLPDCESYFISFATDGYVEQYEINERNSDTVLYLDDPDQVLASASSVAWKIHGHPKGQYFRLISHSVQAGLLSGSQVAYKSEVAGEP